METIKSIRDYLVGAFVVVSCIGAGFYYGSIFGSSLQNDKTHTCITFSGEMWMMRIEDTIGFEFEDDRTNTMTYDKMYKLVSHCTGYDY